jgi:hypothetical protein
MNKLNLFCLSIFLWALTALQAKSQPTVTGPTCVVPGTLYQYLISGPWDSASTMQVCLQGGTLVTQSGACTANGAPLSSLLVTWNPGVSQGSINLSSTAGNFSLALSVTTPLQAGAIITTNKAQAVGYNTAASAIRCGADIGGSCHPNYTHQWQQSLDAVNWMDITGATGQDLPAIPVLRQTRFFRRKTLETGSGSIAYSDIATVQIGAPPPGTILPIINLTNIINN